MTSTDIAKLIPDEIVDRYLMGEEIEEKYLKLIEEHDQLMAIEKLEKEGDL